MIYFIYGLILIYILLKINYYLVNLYRNHKYSSIVIKYTTVKDKILDIGSGDGQIATIIQKYRNLIATDLVPSKNTKINILYLDILKNPLNTNSYDAIVVNHVLHHIQKEKQDKFIDNICQASNHLVFLGEDLPQFNYIFDRISIKYHVGMFSYDNADTSSFHSKGEWIDLFEKRGFKLIDYIHIGRISRSYYWVPKGIFVFKKIK
jgi:2-polyprenyl-3-methyl-5-hydroxy-6-metoxy-1,4-benzoquinol methylase